MLHDFPSSLHPWRAAMFIWTLPVLHAPNLVLGRCHFAWPEKPFGFCWDSFSLSPTCIVPPIFNVCRMSNILQDIAGSRWIRRKVKSFSPSIQATYGSEVWNLFFDWNCLVLFLSFLIFISLEGKNKAAVSWLTMWIFRRVSCLSYSLSIDVKRWLYFILKSMFYDSTISDIIF